MTMSQHGSRLRVAFVMSTEVGLKTQYLNWQKALEADPTIDPVWIPITWWDHNGYIERMPGIPNSVKARIRAWLQVRTGIAKGPFDAVLVAAAHLPGITRYLSRQPYFVTADATPVLLEGFGDLYGRSPARIGAVAQMRMVAASAYYRKAAALFPWSHWAARSMVEDYGADPSRTHVIPPGVDVAHWMCPKRTNEGAVNILFVGGDFHRKGGDLLLDWAANTSAANWRMHLVTRDPVQVDDNRITIHRGLEPNCNELMGLYRNAHVFVLPTRGDCYSLATIEAMAAGLPVILSETGGTGDIVRQAETGYLLSTEDTKELATRLEALLQDHNLRSSMGAAAEADCTARFSATANVQAAAALMRKALGVAQSERHENAP